MKDKLFCIAAILLFLALAGCLLFMMLTLPFAIWCYADGTMTKRTFLHFVSAWIGTVIIGVFVEHIWLKD